jgi:DNA-binding response OmpR family regulator
MGSKAPLPRKYRDVGILMIEDSKGDAFLFKDMMEEDTSDCKHAVTIVENFSDALNYLRYQMFDAVVLDLNLPDMSGIACVSAICSQSSAPLIVYTGLYDKVLHNQSLQCGAKHFFVKGKESPYGLKFMIENSLPQAPAQLICN